MESFRARTLSGSTEEAFEIEGGMKLHERTHEHTNGSLSYSSGNNAFHGRFSQSAEDSDEHSVHKKTAKEFSYLKTYLSTVLFAAVFIAENIYHFKLFGDSHASISFYWLESCVIALFFRFWGRKRIRRSQAIHFLPLLFTHVAVVTTFALDFNQAAYGSSGGSESYTVSIALTPPLILLATSLINRQTYPNKVIVMITISSSLLMVLFCSMEDAYAFYKMSFSNGAFGVFMAASLAFFIVHGKRYLPKATRAELLYLLNFTCVVCLPFLALLFGELSSLEAVVLTRGKFNLVFSVFVLAVLRLASQAASLYQLKYSSPLLNATTRGFAWIWITLAVTFMTPAHTGDFMITVFVSFWIYGFFTYLPVLCSDLRWI